MKLARFAIVLLSMTALISGLRAAFADDAPAGDAKHTIKEVMENAHKSKLINKVLADEATQEEKIELLDNYISLLESSPPKGDMASWNNLAGQAAVAAAKVVVGRDGALVELKTATNCAACHKVHKGE